MAENDLDDVLSIFDEPNDKAEEQPQAEAPAEEKPAEAPAQAAAPQKPAVGKPGMGKPGMGKPGMGKPGLGKPGMTAPRPPMGAAKPAPQAAAPKAPTQPAVAKPAVAGGPAPESIFMPATTSATSRTSPLLFVLLALNAILLIVCAVSFVKVNALNKELTQIKQDTETLIARSKVHAGIAYIGNDKRPQRFIMLLDFDKKPGSVEFGNEKMVPIE